MSKVAQIAGLLAVGFGFAVAGVRAETLGIMPETPAQREARMAWWAHDRFGLFVHWGLYSMPARHEWVKSNERMTDEDYGRYFRNFDPDRADVRAWARAAKAAGMKYAVLTAKHHDGFCLWDTAYTDYKITKTPYGRDFVREFVEAFRAEGLKVGLYYSLVDWHHPDYTVDSTHPARPSRFKGVWDMKQTTENVTNEIARLNEGRDIRRYQAYMKNQIAELLTNYGEISLLWYDWTMDPPKQWCKTAEDYDSVGLLKLTRKLQPEIIVNNRLGLKKYADGWDFATPEQAIPQKWEEQDGVRIPWETCQTFSGSWGYYRDEKSWKSPHQLVELLVRAVAFGGNLIMNVGPTSRGNFDSRAEDALAVYGRWMKDHSRAIYGCTAAPDEFAAPEGTVLTWNPETRRIYVHLLNYPCAELLTCSFADRIDYVQFLHDGSEVKMNWARKLIMPMPAPDIVVPVLEVRIKEK